MSSKACGIAFEGDAVRTECRARRLERIAVAAGYHHAGTRAGKFGSASQANTFLIPR